MSFKYDAETNTDLDYRLLEYLGIDFETLDKLSVDDLEWLREKMFLGELVEIDVAVEELGI